MVKAQFGVRMGKYYQDTQVRNEFRNGTYNGSLALLPSPDASA